MLTDVRDVFFQSNPFKNLGKGLFVGMENPDFTIGTEQYNQKWIIDAYGENFYNIAKMSKSLVQVSRLEILTQLKYILTK